MSALPRPINAHGKVKGRSAEHRKRSRVAVFIRSRGVCEGCSGTAREWSHLFSRRNVIGEPWCSSPELTAALCQHCHQQIDRNIDPSLLADLRWTAVERFAHLHGLTVDPSNTDPIGVMRQLVDKVEELAALSGQEEKE